MLRHFGLTNASVIAGVRVLSRMKTNNQNSIELIPVNSLFKSES